MSPQAKTFVCYKKGVMFGALCQEQGSVLAPTAHPYLTHEMFSWDRPSWLLSLQVNVQHKMFDHVDLYWYLFFFISEKCNVFGFRFDNKKWNPPWISPVQRHKQDTCPVPKKTTRTQTNSQEDVQTLKQPNEDKVQKLRPKSHNIERKKYHPLIRFYLFSPAEFFSKKTTQVPNERTW